MFCEFQNEVVDNICHGLEFHVITGDAQLENMIKRHGGKCVGFPSMFTAQFDISDENVDFKFSTNQIFHFRFKNIRHHCLESEVNQYYKVH